MSIGIDGKCKWRVVESTLYNMVRCDNKDREKRV